MQNRQFYALCMSTIDVGRVIFSHQGMAGRAVRCPRRALHFETLQCFRMQFTGNLVALLNLIEAGQAGLHRAPAEAEVELLAIDGW